MPKKKDKKDWKYWICIRLYSYAFVTKYVRRKYCYIRIYVDIIKMLEKLGQKYRTKIWNFNLWKKEEPSPGNSWSRPHRLDRKRKEYTYIEIHDFYFSNVLHSKNDILELASFFRRPRECFTLPLYLSLLLSLLLSFIHPFLLVIIIYRCNF